MKTNNQELDLRRHIISQPDHLSPFCSHPKAKQNKKMFFTSLDSWKTCLQMTSFILTYSRRFSVAVNSALWSTMFKLKSHKTRLRLAEEFQRRKAKGKCGYLVLMPLWSYAMEIECEKLFRYFENALEQVFSDYEQFDGRDCKLILTSFFINNGVFN